MTQVMEQEVFLEHYGVKGMKWGHRKPTGDEIHSARDRIQSKQLKLKQQQRKVKTERKAGKSTAKSEQKLHEMKVDFLKDPDRITASHLTKGESVVVGLLSAAGGPVGLAALAARQGITAQARRTVAKRQASGYYDKKA